ncbi:19004_t:CDS:2, partial [Cetraspora pellucida]
YEYNIATVSSFYPNAYEYYDNVNTSSSPYPGPYGYDTQPEGADNGIYDERKNNEHEDSENDEEEKNNLLVLCKEMKFSTLELAELYLTNYAKQKEFSFRKKKQIHESEKAILAEDKRDRDSEIIDCPWYINLAFPKIEKEVCINSILGEHNHKINILITEMAPKYRKLTYKMSEKVKFWTIHRKLGLSTQYNLLVASFPGHVINRKDLSNTIQWFKSQAKPSKNDACRMLNDLYSKKEKDPMWIENLINEYPACKSYLMNVLYPYKLNRTSRLTDVVGEIQTIFDQQSKKAVLAECKNEIPTKGISTIMDEYFPMLDKMLKERLTPQILQKQRDQMAQSICYDAKEMAREDDYDQSQSLFPSLLEDIPQNCVQEHLVRFKQTPNVVQSHGPKQRYGFGMGYVKKALDLAIRANKVDDFVNVSIRDLLRVQHKGRQPKRYKSGSKLLKKMTGNKKGERHCQKCGQTGHYAP